MHRLTFARPYTDAWCFVPDWTTAIQHALASPLSYLCLILDLYSDLQLFTEGLTTHLQKSELRPLVIAGYVVLEVKDWTVCWEEDDLGLTFDTFWRNGDTVHLVIGGRHTDYWVKACEETLHEYWTELFGIGVLAENITLSGPFRPVLAPNWSSEAETSPTGPPIAFDGISAPRLDNSEVRRLVYNLHLPLAHDAIVDKPWMVTRIKFGLASYAAMLARICHRDCIIVLHTVSIDDPGAEDGEAGCAGLGVAEYWAAVMMSLIEEERPKVEAAQ